MAGRDLDRGRFLIPDPIGVTLTRPQSLAAGLPESVRVKYVQEQHETDLTVATPMGGILSGTRRVFHLWLIECGGLPPAEGYLITQDDGTVWAIQSTETLAHGRRFRCHCQMRET